MGSEKDDINLKLSEILKAIGTSSQILEDKLTKKIDSFKEEFNELHKKVDKNTQQLSQVQKKIAKQGEKLFITSKLARTNAQNLLRNGIIIKGFPNGAFDENEVIQNILSICGVTHGLNEFYKFTRNIGSDRDTDTTKQVHNMSLNFISYMDKLKVFTKLREKGHFTLGELTVSCPEDQKTLRIWVDHSLTIENLKLRKELLALKRDGYVTSFTLRSGLFLVKHNDPRGIEKVSTVYECAQLDSMLPQVPQNSKRTRPSDSISPSNSPSAQPPKIPKEANQHARGNRYETRGKKSSQSGPSQRNVHLTHT